MQYCDKALVSVASLFINGLLMLSLLFLPELVWASRLEDIAKGMAAGSDKKIQDLIKIGITGGLVIPLLGMLYLVTDKKGLARLAGFIGAIVLGYALFFLHFT